MSSTQEWAAAGRLYRTKKKKRFWDPRICSWWIQLRVLLPPNTDGSLVSWWGLRVVTHLASWCCVGAHWVLPHHGDLSYICWKMVGETSSSAESAFELRGWCSDTEVFYWQTAHNVFYCHFDALVVIGSKLTYTSDFIWLCILLLLAAVARLGVRQSRWKKAVSFNINMNKNYLVEGNKTNKKI